MDPREIAVLCRDQGLGSLGLSTRDFFQVLYDFCADVSRMPAVGGIYNISPKGLTRLLAEVGDPVLRQRTFELMLDVASADGKLDRGEAALLSNVMDAWQVRGPECGPHGARRSRHRGARAAVRHATASA